MIFSTESSEEPGECKTAKAIKMKHKVVLTLSIIPVWDKKELLFQKEEFGPFFKTLKNNNTSASSNVTCQKYYTVFEWCRSDINLNFQYMYVVTRVQPMSSTVL
jgi:hypothetical protein